MITKLDIHLLTRVGKLLTDDAAMIEATETPWTTDAFSKSAKRKYDRILREARDLAALRKRLQADLGSATAVANLPVDGGVRT
jgi:hypothetical protein